MSKIAIVDENDAIIGSAERSVAWTKGLRHRVARVFVVNSEGKILLQKRSSSLADNPGKWDQSAGGHVDAGEDYLAAAKRETLEELGIRANTLVELGKFYTEREAPGGSALKFQIVYKCKWDGPIRFDPAEIAEIRWFSLQEIDVRLKDSPDDFTQSFAVAFALLKRRIK